MDDFNLSSTRLNDRQNHDDFKIAWFCTNNSSTELQNLGEYLKKFDTLDECINFITSCESERKILLVIEDFQFLSLFNDYHQIQGIYILNKNFQIMHDDRTTHSKVVNIYSNERELIVALRRDILLTYRHDLPMTISYLKEITNEQSLMSLDRNAMLFCWNHLFIYYLVNSTSTNMIQLKENLIKQCQSEYRTNSIVLDKIDDFNQNFTPDDVFRWYTCDSFMYRLLNKTFRTRNIDLICKFQYFIIFLYKKIGDLSLEQQDERNLILYRGQAMKENDLEESKANIGHLISINTFMSTTRDREVARMYISSDPIGVLFEINTGTHYINVRRPFANISKFSAMSDEEETLFAVGTVFRIDSVEQESDHVWIIKLTISNEMDGHIDRLKNDFERRLFFISQTPDSFMKIQDIDMIKRYYQILTNESFPLNGIPTSIIDINVGYIWSNLGNYEKAIQFYQNILLNENFIDVPKSIVFYIIIGYNHFNLSKYDEAFLNYGIAYSLLDDKNLLRGELCNHIADVWMRIDRFQIALSCYQEALQILGDNIDHHHLADMYRKMNNAHKKLDHSDEANLFETLANEIDQEYGLPFTPDDQTLNKLQFELKYKNDLTSNQRARHLYSIGLCYIRKRDYSQALENLSQAEQLYMTNRPSDTRSFNTFATLYDNLALVYLFLNDHLKALTMWKKALDIRANIPVT